MTHSPNMWKDSGSIWLAPPISIPTASVPFPPWELSQVQWKKACLEQLPKLPEGKPQLEGATLPLAPDPLCLLLPLLLRAPQSSHLTDVPTIPIAADCSLPAIAPISFLELLLFLLSHMFPLGFPSTSAARSCTSRHRETLNSHERLLP